MVATHTAGQRNFSRRPALNPLMGTSDDFLASFFRWLAISVAVATAAGAGTRLYKTAPSDPCDDLRIASIVPGFRYRIEEYVVVTDKGTRLPLYKWSVAAPDFSRFATASEQQYIRDFRSIRRAPSSEQTNCHGWVFTQGRHLLFGTEIEQILHDNGYRVTERPDADDIIIYRNAHGTIVHSGIVQAVFADGTVMIESKWGISAQFLHLPTDQPYGDTYQYYCTDSATHDVCVMPSVTEHSVFTASITP